MRIFLCSGLFINLEDAHKRASPSTFSLRRPSRSIRPKFFFALRQARSAGLNIICLRSFSLPGELGFPHSTQSFLLSPPFQCFVVKPKISVLILHLSKVDPIISADIAAVVIDLPRIDPELSTNIVKTVSLKEVSFSVLKLKGVKGSVMILCSLEESKIPSSLSNSHERLCWANSNLCSLFANFAITDFEGSIN